MNNIRQVIVSVIAGCIAVNETEISGETDLKRDLSIDSSEMVEIASELEKALKISIHFEDFKNLRTINDCISHLNHAFQVV